MKDNNNLSVQVKNIPYIDIHSHINFAAYDADRNEVMQRAKDANVVMINVGTQKDTSLSAVKLANEYENSYAIVGVHPIHSDKCFHDEQELGEGNAEFTSRGEEFDMDTYREMLQNKKVVGIGECGLDYYRTDPESKQKQIDNFKKQIQLANETGKPLMLHVRKSDDPHVSSAYLDAAEILKSEAKVPFNFHFFAGTIEEAKALLDIGAYFSFTGVITFAKEYEEIVKFIPNDRIMSETDCPYVTPAPHRGKRNEPTYVIEVVKKMAEIKGISVDEMKEHIWKNAQKVFGVKDF